MLIGLGDKVDIHALVSATKPTMDDCVALERVGMMSYEGDLSSGRFVWNMDRLMQLSDAEAHRLYGELDSE